MAAYAPWAASDVASATAESVVVPSVNCRTSSTDVQSLGVDRFLRPLDSLDGGHIVSIAMISWLKDWAYFLCVASTASANSSGSASVESMAISSPFAADADPATVTLASDARASSRSLVRRAMTRTAASFWYSALANSLRSLPISCSSPKTCSASPSHSFWKAASNAGIEVRVGGRGRTIRADLTGMRSSRERTSFVPGSVPFSSTYFSIRFFS